MPLQSFVDFAQGSNVVLHESVGPFFDFNGTDVQSQNIILNHTTQAQVGSVFSALNVSASSLNPKPSMMHKACVAAHTAWMQT